MELLAALFAEFVITSTCAGIVPVPLNSGAIQFTHRTSVRRGGRGGQPVITTTTSIGFSLLLPIDVFVLLLITVGSSLFFLGTKLGLLCNSGSPLIRYSPSGAEFAHRSPPGSYTTLPGVPDSESENYSLFFD